MTARAEHVPVGLSPIALVVHKRRWYCDTPWCAQNSFTEQVAPIGDGARMSESLRDLVAVEIGDQLRPVAEVAATHRIGWQAAHAAFAGRADEVLGRPLEPVAVLGLDETRRGRPATGSRRMATGSLRPTLGTPG
ncbi:hypothetical protein [Nonomuraea sp. B19D2]|uniref:hypothetical protein n=1 Tax=Nonomuraea sp. B19D2 TaxID=3159561 RepID=UPI0032DB3736